MCWYLFVVIHRGEHGGGGGSSSSTSKRIWKALQAESISEELVIE